MSLLKRWSSNLLNGIERLLKPQPQTVQISSPPMNSLCDRIISATAGDSSLSVVPVLDKYLEECGWMTRKLRKCIRDLNGRGRYKHAMEVSDWMTDHKGFHLSRKDIEIRVNLILKLHGLEKAEEYFNSIAKSKPDIKSYNALLYFYAKTKQMEKAEAVFQNIKDLGFVDIVIAYRTMQYLYRKMGRDDKKDLLRQEMDENHISCNVFTFNKRLKAYVHCSDIEGMETLLQKMEEDPRIELDFHSCILAARGYLKAGRLDKTMPMLKRSETLIKPKCRITCYETLLGLYADIGDKASVYRVWDLYRQAGVFSNKGYDYMIIALLKIDDLDGAEKIYEEWESGKNKFDNVRIPKMMIGAFSRKGSLEKAETYINKILEKGMKPDSTSWGHLTVGYIRCGEMKKAVDSLKKALSTPKQVWMPRLDTSAKCLMYLKRQGDKKAAEELLDMINKQCHLSADEYTRLSIDEKDISCDIFTYNKQLKAYVDCSNIEGMETLLQKMEEDPKIEMDFHSCILAAKGYLKAGRFDKTMPMLKRSETLIKQEYRVTCYETLLGLYADIGDKASVYRVWDLYKQVGVFSNIGYDFMIIALLKIDDLDGAEKIYEEWESGKNKFDNFRIPNMMVGAFSRKGSLEKAEAYINKILERSRNPNSTSWGHLTMGYIRCGEMKKAVDSLKKALSTPEQVWMPRFDTSAKCIMYLKRQGDKKAAEELLEMINKQCHLSADEYTRLSMYEKDNSCDIFTFKRLKAYVDCSNIEGMDTLLQNMEEDPKIEMSFNSCILAAKGYLKAGRFDKTMPMLKRSETLIKQEHRVTCYEILLGLYAAIGDKASVYCVWDLYKQAGVYSNQGYAYMIVSLLKLYDLDGAEKIYEEWESGKNKFDIRIPNMMIGAFSKRGLLEKAEAYINKILEKGRKPDSTSWGYLVIGYLRLLQMKKAVDSLKKALSTPKQEWMPRFDTSEKSLMYLKRQGDKKATEELLEMINKQCHLSTDEYTRLSSFVKD